MADDLDETIEETFPASDAPANTPETGIGVNGDRDLPATPQPPEADADGDEPIKN
ncbi:MAG TPA: hypothetical protein VKE51_29440 [Vicinamibacterales bacterium]|nr:hypothetical protein [Vicinamibacterales bacterium]